MNGSHAAGRPNVLIFHCHDLGQYLHCYGVPTVQTSCIDAFAAEGVRFARSYCTAPSCSPSRASLLTGRYPHSNGVMGLTHWYFNWELHDTERHLAAVLHDAGYATCAVGVTHETHRDPRAWGYESYLPQLRARDAVDAAIGQLAAFSQRPQPFFLWVGVLEPHRLPYPEPPAPDMIPHDHGFPGPGLSADDTLGVYVPGYLRDTPGTRRELAGLQGAVRHVDEQFGRLMEALRASGLDQDTLVIFTTDHGVAMPRAKCSLYEPGVQVALILRWSGRSGWCGGVSREQMVSNIDVLPTLCEITGAVLPDGVQGRSFRALLDGEPYTPCDQIFTEMTYHDYYDPRRAVRTETHKLIANFSTAPPFMDPSQQWRPLSDTVTPANRAAVYHPRLEMYDLVADPWEQHDLLEDPWDGVAAPKNPALQAVFRDLCDRLMRHLQKTDDPILQGAITGLHHRHAIEALRLGAGS